MKKIMLATDFSERSDRALRRATLLARHTGASLAIIHAVDDDQPRQIVDSECDAAWALLSGLQETLRTVDGITSEIRVVLADPFAGIARASEYGTPDLLVIGSHRRHLLRDVFVGTTAERTVRAVSCPVLMVNASPVAPYHHVMFATDLSAGARQAALRSVEIGILARVAVSVLHVVDVLSTHFIMTVEQREGYVAAERAAASLSLSAFVKSVGLEMSQQMVRVAETSTAEAILIAAKESSADLVIVGTHGRTGFERFFLGSVAEAVLRGADRDVLAVPPAMAS